MSKDALTPNIHQGSDKIGQEEQRDLLCCWCCFWHTGHILKVDLWHFCLLFLATFPVHLFYFLQLKSSYSCRTDYWTPAVTLCLRPDDNHERNGPMTSSSQRGRLTFKREMFACLVVLLLDLILCLLVCSPQGKEKERLYNGGNLIPTPDQWPAQSPVVVSPADVSEAHFHNGFKSWVYTIWIAFRGNQGFYTHSFRNSNKVTLILTIKQ